MTAFQRYIRLEAPGVWRETPEAQPREVVVSFGHTTLVLADFDDRLLGHWALAGVVTLGREAGATVYSMTADGTETLAIRDREMIAAIAAVSRSLDPPAPPPARRRMPLALLLVLAVLAAAGLVAPRLLLGETARLILPDKAAELGDRMLIAAIERRGPPCAGVGGARALGVLAAHLVPVNPPRLRVMDLGDLPAAALPGRTVLIGREALEAAEAPTDLAGWIDGALAGDPVAALAREAGMLEDLRYMLTGDFGEAALDRAVAAVLAAPPAATPRPSSAASGPLLAPTDWQALTGICD